MKLKQVTLAGKPHDQVDLPSYPFIIRRGGEWRTPDNAWTRSDKIYLVWDACMERGYERFNTFPNAVKKAMFDYKTWLLRRTEEVRKYHKEAIAAKKLD